MGVIDFILRYFLVILLFIELALLPFELVYLWRKSTRTRAGSNELLDFPELLVLLNILVTIILAIVVVITQHMMFR